MKKYHYLIITIIIFFLELLILKIFYANPFIRGFMGDFLVVVFIYTFFKIFRNFTPKLLSFSVLIFAFSIEFLQYFELINLLGLEKNKIAILILGSNFDLFDLLAYFLGVSVIYFTDKYFLYKKSDCN